MFLAPLLLAAGVIALESLATAAFGVLEIPQIRASRLVVGVGVVVLLLGYAVFLITVARGVMRGQRWSRGAGVATQLLQLLLAYSFGQGQTLWIGLVLGVAAALALVCLLLPASTAAFLDEGSPAGNAPDAGSPDAGSPDEDSR